MRCCWTWTRIPMGLVVALVLAGLALPALAETYTWRTEDGVYAYTDDPKHIPARYSDQAKLVTQRDLDSYERFTAQDPAAASHYAERLAQRLAYLRALNAAPQPIASAAAAGAAAPQNAISFSTGGPNDPRLELPVGQDAAAPIVVEPINAKRTGDFRTRRVTVVTQGGKVLAVLKGNPHTFNPANDIADEADLDQGEWDSE